MAIHWYPGHMHKAQRQMRELMPNVDLIIEVLDARIPYSSENPMIAEIREDKPVIKIFNKSDLADPEVIAQWQEHFEAQKGIKTLSLVGTQSGQHQKIIELCKKLFPQREDNQKFINAMIAGIPNVGKSTIINSLAGRTIAKVGNEPAVTKAQQRINLGNGVVLSDTPGILWPKVENPNSTYRLAVTGAIKNTAMEFEDVAAFAAEYLLEAYPEKLKARYGFEEMPRDEIEVLEEIGRMRGGRRAGGRVDLHKASEVLLHDFRSGAIGNICFERPDMLPAEEALVEKLRQEKAEKDERRKKKKKVKR